MLLQGSFCALPKTYNDLKMLSTFLYYLALNVFLVVIVIGGAFYIHCPNWMSYTYIFWFFTLWFGMIGAFTYINKLYQLSFLVGIYIAMSVGIPVIWALLMVLCPCYTSNPGPFSKFIVVTIASLYVSCYFLFIAVYMIFDMFLTLKGEILVRFSL